jgi:hypothetical protein
VSGHISDIGQQASVALDCVDQVAPHFRAGHGLAVYLEASGPKRDNRNQRRLNAVRERQFGLHADGRDAFGEDEGKKPSISDDGARQDANGIEHDSTFQRVRQRRRLYETRTPSQMPVTVISARTGRRRIRFILAATQAVPKVPLNSGQKNP